MNEYVEDVLCKQCDIVGVKYEDVNFEDDLWFFSHQWTKEQEEEFIVWMTEYLQSNKNARAVIMQIPSRGKEICRRVAEAFAFNYGWKYKE